MRAPLAPATTGRAVEVSVRVDMSGRGRDGLLPNDLEPEAFKADDALSAVRQQHHFLDSEVDQYLRPDTIVAQLAAGRLDAFARAAALLGQHDGRRLADQHDDPAPLLGDVAHRGFDLAAAARIALA